MEQPKGQPKGAPTGHDATRRNNLRILLAWRSPLPLANDDTTPKPFLAFSAEDLKMLNYSNLNETDLCKLMECILGCRGTLVMHNEGKAAVMQERDNNLQISQDLLFQPDVPQSEWINTMVPFTETNRAGSSQASESASTSTSASSSTNATNSSQGSLLQDLQTAFKGAEHPLKFDTSSSRHRQEQLRTRLLEPEMDGVCRVTGQVGCEAAHLLKATNPDVVAVHIMATRGGLYPELSVQDFLTFSGTYDCHLAFLVNAGLDGLLDLNRIVFYPNNDKIWTVPLSEATAKQLLDHTALPTEFELGQPIPEPRRVDGKFKVDRGKPGLDPWRLWWDWQVGSRILARYGTKQALDLSKSSVLYFKVDKWNRKKAKKRGTATATAAAAAAVSQLSVAEAAE